jgi:hypothetical protein
MINIATFGEIRDIVMKMKGDVGAFTENKLLNLQASNWSGN